MSQFEPRIPRDLAVRLGEEAVAISKAGRYVSPAGEVEITAHVTNALKKARYYAPEHVHSAPQTGHHQTQFEVTNETTLSAHRRHQDKGHNVVSLNFASATHPGGGFLSGARAQEEYLCRSSALYLTLKDWPMYDYHRAKGGCLYSDAMIYSPDVPVFRDDEHDLLPSPYQASFITSAAPLAKHLQFDELHQLRKTITSRIRKIITVAQENGHDSLILGAWGCGAFGNNGNLMADLFHQALTEDFAGAFKEVTFAVVDTSPDARFIDPFRRRFGQNALGVKKPEKPLELNDVVRRTNNLLKKHLRLIDEPRPDDGLNRGMNALFQNEEALICDLEFEFRLPSMSEPDVSRMNRVGQLYAYIMKNGREP
jgi:uncharacterized protein (TIGR02452 family)